MRLLFVEDDEHFSENFVSAVRKLPGEIEVLEVRSKEAVLRAFQTSNFDLVVCDLSIPSEDGLHDSDTSHGLAVLASVREHSEGTPILYFSAFGTLANLKGPLTQSGRDDYHGTRNDEPIVDFIDKAEVPECLDRIRIFSEHFEVLSSIEIAPLVAPVILSAQEKKVLRIFARRLGGVVVQVSEFGGGLSQNRTVLANILNENGHSVASVIGKIGAIANIRDECERYRLHIAPNLQLGSFAHFADKVVTGACGSGGVFYRLAEVYTLDVFQILSDKGHEAANLVNSIRQMLGPWRSNTQKHITVGAIRKAILPDSKISRISEPLNFDLAEIDAISLYSFEVVQHGDLHGCNVLVSNDLRPVVIDYGDIGVFPAPIDAITLELSTVSHPKGTFRTGAWPTVENVSNWADLEAFSRGCPSPDFISACRQWAIADSPSANARYAAVLGYGLRQLSYNDTNHELALALVNCAVAQLLA